MLLLSLKTCVTTKCMEIEKLLKTTQLILEKSFSALEQRKIIWKTLKFTQCKDSALLLYAHEK